MANKLNIDDFKDCQPKDLASLAQVAEGAERYEGEQSCRYSHVWACPVSVAWGLLFGAALTVCGVCRMQTCASS